MNNLISGVLTIAGMAVIASAGTSRFEVQDAAAELG